MPTGCSANRSSRVGRLVPGVLLLTALAACRTSPRVLAEDLQRYLAQVQRWAPIESETNRTIDRILSTQFVDEAEARRQIAANRAGIGPHLEYIRTFSPLTTPVQQLHRLYVDGWERLLHGYAEIEEGFSSGDYSHITRGRAAMLAWRDVIRRVAAELRRLAEQAGVPVGPAAGGGVEESSGSPLRLHLGARAAKLAPGVSPAH